jgi:hypothetical protein
VTNITLNLQAKLISIKHCIIDSPLLPRDLNKPIKSVTAYLPEPRINSSVKFLLSISLEDDHDP